jgi:hypothetical protein
VCCIFQFTQKIRSAILDVLRSDFSLPKIYQRPNVVLTKSVIVKWFSDGLVIRLKCKLILQKKVKFGVNRRLGAQGKNVRAKLRR